jgi:hypothetical protein
MKRLTTFLAVAAFFLAFGVTRARAQGPAGNGAGAAVAPSSGNASSGGSRSYNPLHWMKKSKSSSNDQLDTSSDRDKKLDANLKSAGVLPQSGSLTDACSPFTSLRDCLATLHASKNAGIDFNCLRADVTGVETGADVSACKGTSDKRMDLHKAIHLQKPEVDAKAQAKNAEKQAQDDLKDAA